MSLLSMQKGKALKGLGLVFAIYLSLSGCSGKKSEDWGLSIKMSPNLSYLYPDTKDGDTLICYDNDIAAPRIQYNSLFLTFAGNAEQPNMVFEPIMLRIKINGGGAISNDYECTLTGTDNSALGFSAFFGQTQTYMTATPTAYKSVCPIHCGGISISSNYQGQAFSIRADVEIVGMVYDPTNLDVLQKPVRARTNVEIKNLF